MPAWGLTDAQRLLVHGLVAGDDPMAARAASALLAAAAAAEVATAPGASALTADVAAREILALVTEAVGSRGDARAAAAGDELVALVEHVGVPVVPIAAVYAALDPTVVRDPLALSQVAWVLARQGPGPLLAVLEADLTGTDDARRRFAAAVLDAGAGQVGRRYGPLRGGAAYRVRGLPEPAPQVGQATPPPAPAPAAPQPRRVQARPQSRNVHAIPPPATGEPPPPPPPPLTRSRPGLRLPSFRRSRAAHAAPAAPADPPRTAFARLECPARVVAGNEFALTVGLAAQQLAGVLGDELRRPDTSVGSYVLSVRLLVDGFEPRIADDLTVLLPVTAERPHPSAEVRLVPRADPALTPARSIAATFAVDGTVIGYATRSVLVVDTTAELAGPGPDTEAVGATMSIPTDERPPDLTLTVSLADDAGAGRLVWTWESPHDTVAAPRGRVTSSVGTQPQQFLRNLIDDVAEREGQDRLVGYFTGVSKAIGEDAVPADVWDALRAAAGASDGPPTVLLLTEEPYIPWELARVDPPFDPQRPPFLGAQAVVGRWTVTRRLFPPPVHLDVRSMAVISGVYDQVPGWRRLVQAEREAADLGKAYDAVQVDATARAVGDALGGHPATDVVHFAMHGSYDPNGGEDGLVLVDQERLNPMDVRGCDLKQRPFVFLNACQVGASNAVLGDYAGMADAFLHAGAVAVVAPLWSIHDEVARDVAKRFYAEVFAGTPPARFVSDEKARTMASTLAAPSGTHLAYVYFGHPNLRVDRRTTRRRSRRHG